MRKLINIVSHCIFGAVLLLAGASTQASETQADLLVEQALAQTRVELLTLHITHAGMLVSGADTSVINFSPLQNLTAETE